MVAPPTGTSSVSLAGLSLTKADVIGLGEGESLEMGSVAVPLTPNDCVTRSRPVAVDFVDFLYELDRRHFAAMYGLSQEGVGLPTANQGHAGGSVQFVFQPVAVRLHRRARVLAAPALPPASRGTGTIGRLANSPMVNGQAETVVSLAGRRVFGKPYNVSEYCHPAPSTYCAEQIPTVTSFGAFQDWDGIGLHCWSEFSYDWRRREVRKLEPDRIDSYFNICRHPVKLVTLPFGALAFRRGDVAAARDELAIGVTPDEEKNWLIDQPRRAQWWLSFHVASLKGADLARRVHARDWPGPGIEPGAAVC